MHRVLRRAHVICCHMLWRHNINAAAHHHHQPITDIELPSEDRILLNRHRNNIIFTRYHARARRRHQIIIIYRDQNWRRRVGDIRHRRHACC